MKKNIYILALLMIPFFFSETKNYKIAFVKQTVYQDLYCAPFSASVSDIIFSSLKRSGPSALFTKLNADFIIVHLENDRECNIWKEKATHCKQCPLSYYLSLIDHPPKRWSTPQFEYSQGHYAQYCKTIDWGKYDIVIAMDCAVPARITKHYPNTLWAYYVGEGSQPSHRNSYNHIINGYDCYLTQDYYRNRHLKNHVIEFPYHLQYYGCFHELLDIDTQYERTGISLEIHTNDSLTQEEKNKLTQFGSVTSASQGEIKNVISALIKTKYYVLCIDRGGRKRVRGNAIVEAITAGNLVIAKKSNVDNKDILTPRTMINSFNDLTNRIAYFEANPEEYRKEVELQRNNLNYLCYERPIQTLFDKCDEKQKENK